MYLLVIYALLHIIIQDILPAYFEATMVHSLGFGLTRGYRFVRSEWTTILPSL
jgi:hypothetical protein